MNESGKIDCIFYAFQENSQLHVLHINCPVDSRVLYAFLAAILHAR